MIQLCKQAPPPVWDIFEACWNRATPWIELLGDAIKQVWPALREPTASLPLTLRAVRQHTTVLAKVSKHLSRYGSAYAAFWELWQDLHTPRVRQVLGPAETHQCPLCQVVMPSKHALAAHCHRKHTVVNHLTKYTNGTVCLWCHCEHFTTDRLKYHLRTQRACMRGLRVLVGESYIYGTGTKRTGARPHRGLPAQRLPGPLNATPVQRAAALEGRDPTEAELRQELQSTVGVADEYHWPPLERVGSIASTYPLCTARADAGLPNACLPPCALSPRAGGVSVSRGVVWRRFADWTHASVRSLPTPLWSGLATETLCLGLPQQWHRFWQLWHAAADASAPWAWHHRPAQRLLRVCQDLAQSGTPSRCATPSTEDLLAATVTFRYACQLVLRQGLFWIPGVPSAIGLKLIRGLLPEAAFHILPTAAGRIFVAAHSGFPAQRWSRVLCSAFESVSAAPHLLGGFMQPSFVYHLRSPDGAASL